MATFRDDPYGDFNFLITIPGVGEEGLRAAFSEVAGLEVRIEVVEYRNGNEDITVRKLPGLKKFTNLTLKRGVIGDLAFWQWIRSAMDGQVRRVDGTIELLNESREPVLRWRFRRGWPCRYAGPSLSAKTGEVAIETIEICHEGLELE
ncbi:MAG TPA: phage tail protein [Candidatus Krumholzibacteria bacterium]|nr:phage tail protein [Candidatus Krumholzibacteria bacterium]HPD71774.1 phage tail protein [Candidatus Krumholzibacteria bacterium]HRY41293.1 phage tail protein [Candidatus Krumholzibacteria bacterium]